MSKAFYQYFQLIDVFLFDEPLKLSKSLKIFKISLTFRFTGENSQILTVSKKKYNFV
jgi:hypothetical protein